MSTSINIPKAKKRSTSRLLKAEGIYSWGAYNDQPQRVLALIAASGTATRCVGRYSRFIVGRGFADPILYKSVIDRDGNTMDKLLQLTSKDFASLNGFAIHVRYNGLGQVIERKYMPFADTRLTTDGMIAYYDNWDGTSEIKRYNKADIVKINRFNPSKVIEEINAIGDGKMDYATKVQNYQGQVLWYSIAGHDTYPLAPCDSVLEDIETDYQAKLYKNKNIRTSFTASGMLINMGKSETEEQRTAIQDSLTEYQGAESAGNMMYGEVDSKEETPTWIPFGVDQANDTRFKYHEESVELSIVKAYAIPPVLAGIMIAGKLGTSSELEDAYMIYNSETEPERIIVEEQFNRLLGYPVAIMPLQFTKTIQNDTTA
jgi:hypothetical protein